MNTDTPNQQENVNRDLSEDLRLRNAALDAAANGILITDPSGNILWVNAAFTTLTGYTAQEVLGKNPRFLGSGRQDEETYRNLWQTISSGQVWSGELTNRRKDGSLYIEEMTITPVRSADGAIARYIAIKQDVSERKQAEAELRWKTAFLEAQVNSSLDGILVVNEEGKKILQNKRAIQLWKLPPDIVSGREDREQVQFVMHKLKNPQAFVEKVEFLYAHPNEVSRDEIELADGTILDRYSSPLMGKDGTYYGRIWTFRDITEQRQLEAQLRQAQKMEAVGQLAGGVAHDFNNILSATLMHLGLLQQNPQLTLGTRESLKEVERETLRAAKLTRQLLLFSQRQAARIEPLDMNVLINDLLKMLRRLLGENIEVAFLGDAGASWVSADAGMMEQVVMNLCINARDAMPNGGRLALATRMVDIEAQSEKSHPDARPGRFVCLSVTDMGCGMDETVLRRIFEPFFTTKEVGKGTGLGLATVYGIVKQHEGWIEVESAVGQGSSFRVWLPATSPLSDSGISSDTKEVKGGTETILLVEDELFLRRLVAQGLRKLGYAVLEAGNGLEALKVWEQHHPRIALLFTDMVMPGKMSGLELAVRLKKEKSSLKVISSSGYDADLARRHTSADLEITHLPKPYLPSDLAKVVRHCLDQP
jgi:PAS domain S-box-containing protein